MKVLRVFYIIVLVFSLLTVYGHLNNLVKPTVFVSLIGIVASVLFFLKKSKFYFLSLIWIIVQIPFISSESFSFDLSQFSHFHISFGVGSFFIGINMQALFLLFTTYIVLSKFLYRNVNFKAYSENPKLSMEKEYSFVPTEISPKGLVGKVAIRIDDKLFSTVEFSPKKSGEIQKAAIILISSDNDEAIKATVTYRLGY